MSEFAIVPELGENMTGWEYMDLYRDRERQFKNFFCPYCGIPLIGKAIYNDISGKSPHFAIFPNRPHRFNCDGRPEDFNPGGRVKTGEVYIKVEMNFPQKLTKSRYFKERVANICTELEDISEDITEQVVQKRRAADRRKQVVPSSSNLRNFANTYEHVIPLWKEKNGNKQLVWSEINEIRKQMPLILQDNTNYNDGFRTPMYLIRDMPRIYHSKGTVCASENEIRIESVSKTNFGENDPLSFYVSLDLGSIIKSNGPIWHTESLNALHSFAISGEQITWYAYGLPKEEKDAVILQVESMDHIHFYTSREPLRQ
jgi:hypothetical protein